jgi:hypothetical protein
VKEEEREEGKRNGGKKGMKEERNVVRQMERMEDICNNKMHNELKT